MGNKIYHTVCDAFAEIGLVRTGKLHAPLINMKGGGFGKKRRNWSIQNESVSRDAVGPYDKDPLTWRRQMRQEGKWSTKQGFHLEHRSKQNPHHNNSQKDMMQEKTPQRGMYVCYANRDGEAKRQSIKMQTNACDHR